MSYLQKIVRMMYVNAKNNSGTTCCLYQKWYDIEVRF